MSTDAASPKKSVKREEIYGMFFEFRERFGETDRTPQLRRE
jgi:hypothetical protein